MPRSLNIFHMSQETKIELENFPTEIQGEIPITQAENHAQTKVGEESVLASLGLNGQLFAFQLINFALVVLIIWFLILKPLAKKLEERRQLIDDSLDKAKQVETNLQMAEIKFQERVDEAKSEASRIVSKATEEAEKTSLDLKAKSKKEIELLIDQAKRNIKIEREDALKGVKEEAATLITLTMEKILKEKMDGKKDKQLIEQSLKEIE